jgi:hypothetical protein
MARKRHPKPEVEAAIRHAESHGWRIPSEAPTHGERCCVRTMMRPVAAGSFCIYRIWSTPQNPGNHGKQIRRVVDNCVHKKAGKSVGQQE